MESDDQEMSSRGGKKRSEGEARDVRADSDALAEREERKTGSNEEADENRGAVEATEEEAPETSNARQSSDEDEREEKEVRRERVSLPTRAPLHKTPEPREEAKSPEKAEARDPEPEPDEDDSAEDDEQVAAPRVEPEPAAPIARNEATISARRDEPADDQDADDEDDEITGRERVVRSAVLALLLIVATVLAYQKAWNAGFIWDDDVYVTANQLLTAPDGLKRIWLSLDSPSQYFPLVYTSFRLEHALWGLNATGYHWVNIILHALNALLLWRLLRALEIPGAWLGAALFALHPVHVESVAWISERKNVLMGFFFLLSLLAWQKFVAGKRRGSITFYLLALLCFAFALASKTTACMLPVALLLISWLKRGAISLARVIQVFPFVVVGLGMGLLTIWWERYHQGTQGELFAIGLFDRVLIAARAFWFYLFKLAWPAELAFSYPRFNISAADPIDYLWLGGFVALVLAIWILRRWIGRGPEVALTFFFAMLAPTLGFVMLYTFRYTFVADHYQYLASIGPLALAGAAVTMALNPLGRAKTFVLPLVCAALLVPLGLRTWQQGGVYKDEETLWRATIATNPGSWMAQNNLAVQLLSRDRYNEAIDRFEEALRLEPNYAEAHYNLGNAFFRTGQLERARTHYERALQINPRIAVAHTNLGILLSDNGDEANAIKHFEEAVKIEPRAVVAQQRLSEALVRQGRTAEAVQHFDAAAKINPASTQSDAQNEIALALLRQGRAPEAIAQAKRTIEANPNNSAAYTNYGIILAELRQADEAMAQFEKALELDPSNAQAHYNVGNTLLMQRRVEEAMARYRRAIEIQPDNAAAHLNLGNTLAEFGRADEAIAEYEKALEIRPDYANAHTNLATALNRLGRFDEAMTHLQTAWKLEAQARSSSPAPTPAR